MSMLLATEEGLCTCDLAEAVNLTDATVSHHLRQLRKAGLVEGQRAGMNVYYRALRPGLAALCQVIEPHCYSRQLRWTRYGKGSTSQLRRGIGFQK